MENGRLYARTESGRKIAFSVTRVKNSLFLRLPKEELTGCRQLRALPELAQATVGEEGYWILPRRTSFSADVQTFFRPREDLTFLYREPLMSCYGVKTPAVTCLVRVERSYNYAFEAVVKDGVYSLAVLYDFTRDEEAKKDICLEIIELPATADYNDMATVERELRLQRGEIVSLAEKCRCPAAEYARKYPMVRIRMGWKPVPPPVLYQTEQTEPEMFTACDFARVRAIADEMKRQGVKGAELQLVGWNRSGHDGRWPQMFPADPRLGGNKGLQETVDYVKKLGYRISTHTNLLDAYTIADTFTPEDITVTRGGDLQKFGQWGGGLSHRVCPVRQLANAHRDLPELAAYGEDGLHYIDVTSIVIPDICHSPAHPSDMENGILYAQKLEEYTRGLFGGFSSEGGMDFALRDLDFALYLCFGDGFNTQGVPVADRLLPFYELTYHGTVLYNPCSQTVNYSLKDPRTRLLLYMRGGKPAMYYYSKFLTNEEGNWMGMTDLVCDTEESLRESVAAVRRAAEEYAAFADRQLVYMRRYDILDNGLHIATYADGVRMVGNFTDAPVSFEGQTVPALDFILM